MITVYDIECFINLFLVVFKNWNTGELIVFEISERKDDSTKLSKFIKGIKIAVGYNNLNYDHPLLRYFYDLATVDSTLKLRQLKDQSNKFIGNPNAKFNRVFDKDYENRDLFSIWHYDNAARSCSLKKLQISMNWPDVMESTVEFDEYVPLDKIDEIITYCINDVNSTEFFARKSLKKIRERVKIREETGLKCTNYSDSKLGEMLILDEYCKSNLIAYKDIKDLRTSRPIIPVREIIDNSISFESDKFKNLLTDIKTKTIFKDKKQKNKNKDKKISYKLLIQDVVCDLKEGGLHGAISGSFHSDDEYIIIDGDVSSMYIATVNKLKIKPAHFNQLFNKIVEKYYNQRIINKAKVDKGDYKDEKELENLQFLIATYKLVLVNIFGKFGDAYSPLNDDKCTYQVTINGQLLILKWIEMLLKVRTLQLLYVNTDGITVRIKKEFQSEYYQVCEEFKSISGYELEFAIYDRLEIRDVNNYCAITDKGKIKTKGEYVYLVGEDYHKTINFQISRKAAVLELLQDIPFKTTIDTSKNIYDFIGSTRFRHKKSKEFIYNDEEEEDQTDDTPKNIINEEEIFVEINKPVKVSKIVMTTNLFGEAVPLKVTKQKKSKIVESDDAPAKRVTSYAKGYLIDNYGVKAPVQANFRFVFGRGKHLFKFYDDGRTSKMFEAKQLIDCSKVTDELVKQVFDTLNYPKYYNYSRKLIEAVRNQQNSI